MYYDFNSLFNSMSSFNSAFNFNSLFNPFFSHKKNVPVTTVTGNDVNMGAGLSYSVKTNGLSIHGNTGFEKVTIAQNVSGIKIDSAVESVTLKGVNFDSNLLISSKGNLAINSTTGNLATLNLTANRSETLNFDNAIGTVSLDNSGNGIFNLSEILLNKNQNFTAATNDLLVYGNSGQEKVTLGKNITGVEIFNAVETVVLDGNSSNYSYNTEDDFVIVTNTATGNDTAFIHVNTAASGTKIQFADKTLTASWEILDSFGSWNYWGIAVSDPTAPAIPTTISGGTNLPYSVDFSGSNLGSNLANVEANVKTALENIGKYVSSKITFNLQILTEQAPDETLAESNGTMIRVANEKGATQNTTTFIAESISGVNSYTGADATIYINLANLNQMSFDGTPSANQYDLTSILTHEILHGMAFTGNLGTMSDEQSPFDSLVMMQNNLPVFTGSHAKAANGNNPVPLVSIEAGDGSAYYHVAFANDLMSDSLGKGETRTISPLDVAMLQDMGLTIVGVPPVQSTLVA